LKHEIKNSALIIIDLINDFNFKHGSLLSKNTLNIIDNIVILRQFFINNKLPIIYVNDNYQVWTGNYLDIVDRCYNNVSCRIIDKIFPGNDEYFVTKNKFSAFYCTNLEPLLRQLNITTLVLVGIAGNVCIYFSAVDAHMRNFKLFVPSDCIASNYIKDNNIALKSMKHLLDADISISSDLTI
jgi:nicotinamidase-related amidase